MYITFRKNFKLVGAIAPKTHHARRFILGRVYKLDSLK